MTAEDIPRFAACTTEAYRGHPLFDHLFGPVYSPSAVETIFGASIVLPRPIGRLGHGRRECGGPVPAAGGQGSIHRRIPRARRPETPRLRRSRHRETPVRLRILLQRGHGKTHRRGYVVSFQPLRKTGVPRERALVEGHKACPGAHRGQGTGCYLETQKGSNVGLYEHLGFEVAEEGTVPGSDIPISPWSGKAEDGDTGKESHAGIVWIRAEVCIGDPADPARS